MCLKSAFSGFYYDLVNQAMQEENKNKNINLDLFDVVEGQDIQKKRRIKNKSVFWHFIRKKNEEKTESPWPY